MKATRLLIAGIPGTGKTTVGEALEVKYHFTHLDFETDVLQRFHQNPESVYSINKDIVVTWGFAPDPNGIATVGEFERRGYRLLWFDGNRSAARREFLRRGDVSEEALDIQLDKIDSSNVVALLNPRIVNTFDSKGEFKAVDTIIAECLT